MTGRAYAFESHVEAPETAAPYPTNDELAESRRIDEKRRERAHRARNNIRGDRHDRQ